LLQVELEERDKELRAARLEIKRLNRFLAPTRRSLGKPLYMVVRAQHHVVCKSSVDHAVGM
jgi:hypothetical protein